MPRCARIKSDIGIFHIMFRGINKQTIFEEDEDRERFLNTIKRFKDVSKYEIYGYCLMSNHVHLLIKEIEEGISTAIKRVCSSYVYWYNRKYERCGHLFQERFKSEIVDNDAYLLTVLRYIHQNPVKAGLAKSIQDYKWTSYNEYINRSVMTDTSFILQMFSADKEKAKESFIKHANEKNEDKCLEYIEKVRIPDSEVTTYLNGLGIQNYSFLQQANRDKRNEIIRKMKSIEGVTIRQLSRITGIPKSVIDRI